MDDVKEFLKGKKTYIIMTVGIIVFGAEQMGALPPGTVDGIDKVLILLGLGSLRAGFKNEKDAMMQGK